MTDLQSYINISAIFVTLFYVHEEFGLITALFPASRDAICPWKMFPKINWHLNTVGSNCIKSAKYLANYRMHLITFSLLRGRKCGVWYMKSFNLRVPYRHHILLFCPFFGSRTKISKLMTSVIGSQEMEVRAACDQLAAGCRPQCRRSNSSFECCDIWVWVDKAGDINTTSMLVMQHWECPYPLQIAVHAGTIWLKHKISMVEKLRHQNTREHSIQLDCFLGKGGENCLSRRGYRLTQRIKKRSVSISKLASSLKYLEITHCDSITNSSRLILLREEITFYSKDHTKHINMLLLNRKIIGLWHSHFLLMDLLMCIVCSTFLSDPWFYDANRNTFSLINFLVKWVLKPANVLS
jgi:hypothetical protein